MCLIKSTIHIKDYSKPFVAEKDIIVYKALDHRDSSTGKKTLRTPYQYCPISFTDGKCVMDGDLECTYDKNVSIGFHTFTSEGLISLVCEMFTATKMTKHWAIIPKGSKYFIGIEDEIVSNKLIIFKTREDFRKYRRSQK